MSIGNIPFALRGYFLHPAPMTHGDMIAKNLERILAKKGLQPIPLAEKAGLGRTAVRDILTRKSKNPTHKTLELLARTIGIDVNEITGGPKGSSLTDQERELLSLFSRLSDAEQAFLLKSAKGLNASVPPEE